MKRSLFDECLDVYREDLEKRMKLRGEALAHDMEAANLGVDVIERGARDLMVKFGVDIDELEKSNDELSQALEKRRIEIDDKLRSIPDDAREERRRLNFLMQQAACIKGDPCIPGPATAIMAMVAGECDDANCQASTSVDHDLGRVHLELRVRGERTSRMRSGEVWALFIWRFTPAEAATYVINPLIEFHGRYASSREYHCYADTSGSGHEFAAYIGHSQPGCCGVLPSFSRVGVTLPLVAGAMRYDGYSTPNYICHLEAGHETHVQVALQFRCNARSRYAACSYNFGDPPSDNYIAMPRLCFTPWH